MENPFPGPQPYRASDQARFFGREDAAARLRGNVVANRCVTVYGPSGAGKSSLMQASVIPTLVASHGIRAVRIDGWPGGEDPTRWLASAMYAQLGMGDVPADLAPGEAIVQAAQRAARRSPRLVLVYLDQIEQLLYTSRPAAEVDAFFEQVETLVDLPLRNARVALSLREDYLGRFRDRLRDRGRLLENAFRVGPLTVAELRDAVCQAAATGEPPQEWSLDQMREVILQVRVPGEAATDSAEAQAAYAQIVCRALFQERADKLKKRRTGPTLAGEVKVKAELILYRYLDTTLDDLGPLAADARRLLEDHLVTADGSRTLRTEKELLRILPQENLQPILGALEDAAILHAEAHQGSRYFEIGHDWLARKVYEQRQQRERAEEDRRLAEAHAEALRKQRAEADARLAQARAQRRSLVIVAVVAVGVAAGAAALFVRASRASARAEAALADADQASREARLAEGRAKDAQRVAESKAIEAFDARLIAGARQLKSTNQLAWADQLLSMVRVPAQARGWVALANDALHPTPPAPRSGPFHSASIAPDGKLVVSAYDDKKARRWSVDGAGSPVVFEGHAEWVTSAAPSPDGRLVVTASFDRTARIWSADGAQRHVLRGHTRAVRAVAWSPDGAHVVTASDDMTARTWSADGALEHELRGHADGLTSASWSPDGQRIVTTSLDFSARLWSADGTPERPLEGHAGEVYAASWSPDGTRVVTASEDGTARVWDAASGARLVMLEHRRPVSCAVWSPRGDHIATWSEDGKVRVWSADGKGEPVIFDAPAPVIALLFLDEGKALLGVAATGAAHTWALDVDALKKELAAAGADCLPVDVRTTYLDEAQHVAEQRYDACKAGHPESDLGPLAADPAAAAGDTVQALPGPSALVQPGAPRPAPHAGKRRVDVLVLPGDAEVVVDGQQVRRRDGVVEVLVDVGGEKHLDVHMGATSTKVQNKSVTIHEAESRPVVVDLDKPEPGAGVGGARGPQRPSGPDE
jgi:Tol biopolymer transport system component